MANRNEILVNIEFCEPYFPLYNVEEKIGGDAFIIVENSEETGVLK